MTSAKTIDSKTQLNRTRLRVAVFAMTVLAVAAAIPVLLIEGII